MAYPQLSKSGVTTFVFSRGHLWPVETPEDFGQIVQESEAGLRRIATLRPPIARLVVHFEGLPLSDITGMRTFLHDPLVRAQAAPFTWTDSISVSTDVYYDLGSMTTLQNSSNRYSVALPFRKAVVAW